MKRKNEQSIGEILREYLKMTQLENHVFESRIAEVWQEVLGDRITLETDRIHLQSGTLFVTLKSPSLKNDIMMQRTVIRTLLNEKLGGDIIKSVVIR
jgi:predicted nucleic acid-binding Zn ribbon protein